MQNVLSENNLPVQKKKRGRKPLALKIDGKFQTIENSLKELERIDLFLSNFREMELAFKNRKLSLTDNEVNKIASMLREKKTALKSNLLDKINGI